MLELELQEDKEKLAELRRDHEIAKQRVGKVLDYALTSMWWLAGSGILNLYCGIALQPCRRRAEPIGGENVPS